MDEITKSLPLWKNLYNAVIETEYGVLYPHKEIEEILGIPRLIDGEYNNEEYYCAISEANIRLIKEGKMIYNVFGVGYKVLNPNEYPDYIREREEKAAELRRNTLTVTAYAPRDHMDAGKRELLDRQQATITRQLLNNSKDLKQLYSNMTTKQIAKE